MGGITAGGRAASHGAKVLVVEKASRPGGSALLSSASLWTVPSMAVFRERCPRGDEALGAALIDGFPAAVDWVRSTGVHVSEPRTVLGYGSGFRFDIKAYFEHCEQTVKAAGGALVTGQTVDELVVESGEVVGARVGGTDPTTVRARATVLATGGFQASEDLRARYLGANGRDLLVYSNPHSSGDGLRLGVAAGAGTAGDMDTFYGHLISWPLPQFTPREFMHFDAWWSEFGVLLNTRGERFTDESRGDYENAQALTREDRSRAVVIIDEALRSSVRMNEVSADAGLADAARAGARVATIADLAHLATRLDEWGFAGSRGVTTLQEYNAEAARGAATSPPRTRWCTPLTRPPFHVVEVRPAIGFTEGGLRVDPSARVTRVDGRPVPGLYAAGADIGGIYNGGYAGGLSLACVFGMRAADMLGAAA
jgi:succinate dehydrogenase/fumarate reductase flavoprotein subunit